MAGPHKTPEQPQAKENVTRRSATRSGRVYGGPFDASRVRPTPARASRTRRSGPATVRAQREQDAVRQAATHLLDFSNRAVRSSAPSPDTVACPYVDCNHSEATNNPLGMQEHIQNMHVMVICPWCNQRFAQHGSARNLAAHITDRHAYAALQSSGLLEETGSDAEGNQFYIIPMVEGDQGAGEGLPAQQPQNHPAQANTVPDHVTQETAVFLDNLAQEMAAAGGQPRAPHDPDMGLPDYDSDDEVVLAGFARLNAGIANTGPRRTFRNTFAVQPAASSGGGGRQLRKRKRALDDTDESSSSEPSVEPKQEEQDDTPRNSKRTRTAESLKRKRSHDDGPHAAAVEFCDEESHPENDGQAQRKRQKNEPSETQAPSCEPTKENDGHTEALAEPAMHKPILAFVHVTGADQRPGDATAYVKAEWLRKKRAEKEETEAAEETATQSKPSGSTSRPTGFSSEKLEPDQTGRRKQKRPNTRSLRGKKKAQGPAGSSSEKREPERTDVKHTPSSTEVPKSESKSKSPSGFSSEKPEPQQTGAKQTDTKTPKPKPQPKPQGPKPKVTWKEYRVSKDYHPLLPIPQSWFKTRDIPPAFPKWWKAMALRGRLTESTGIWTEWWQFAEEQRRRNMQSWYEPDPRFFWFVGGVWLGWRG